MFGAGTLYEERLRWAVVQPGEQVTSGRPSSSLSLHVKWLLRKLVCGGDRHKLKQEMIRQEKLRKASQGSCFDLIAGFNRRLQ